MKVLAGVVAQTSCGPPTFEPPSEERAVDPAKNRCRPQPAEPRGPHSRRSGGQLRRGARARARRRPPGGLDERPCRRPEPEVVDRRRYFAELFRLQPELVKLQDWVVSQKLKVVILFEGRDAAGKGGVIKRITQRLNPRVCRVVALPAPSERERTQWYFQRYVTHLPGGGEIVLFDRSWYNRAGVERVMGFCTDADVEEFFRTVPEFERMLVRSGIILLKYWFSITDDEQHLRFQMRIHDPLKQWKLSPMDLESRRRWEEYTKAKEAMLERTHIAEAPWWVVEGGQTSGRGSTASTTC